MKFVVSARLHGLSIVQGFLCFASANSLIMSLFMILRTSLNCLNAAVGVENTFFVWLATQHSIQF
jgi:hypothetical protein